MSLRKDNANDTGNPSHDNSSGPSRSSKKSKNGSTSSKQNSIELGNSLLNLNIHVAAAHNHKTGKHKQKPHGTHHKVKKSPNVRQLLSERLRMYSLAEHMAKEQGEMKKAKELYKEVQLLNALIAHHDSGNLVDVKTIPPEISDHFKGTKASSSQIVKGQQSEEWGIPFPDLESTSSSESEASVEKILGILRLRRDQYKISVVQNRTVGNVSRALEHLNIIKMFDNVIRHIEMGEKVDLNELPGPPECPICHINPVPEDEPPKGGIYSDSSIDDQIVIHTNILKELQQRLRAYEILKQNSKRENDLEETVRLDQILKLYREAIKLHRARKTVPIEELPSPPGFPSLHNLRMTWNRNV